MLKKIGLVGITAAATAALVIACSDGTTPNSIVCSADADCRVGEICHPDAKVCVQTCESGDDCPDASKNCDALSATDSTKICKCTTTPLCQGGVAGPDSICSETFDVCTPKCASNLDCGSGLECDTATGECKPASTDGGTDGGTGAACDWASAETACATGEKCNLEASQCQAAVSCTGEGQAGVCSYGSACESGTCDPVDRPDPASCSPFSHNNISWNPATDRGPVIYSIENVTDDTSFCSGSATAQTIEIKAYSPTPFPTDKNQLNGFVFVRQDGSTGSLPPSIKPSQYQGGGTNNITVRATLCNSTTSGAFTQGFQFAQGNQFCFLVQ
ncbi:MAG: hypothetical protein IRZ16_08965 [Myxococcaceae bacterium]|nr:hypothetical protein [Myxococcaceae bacterium]